MKDVLVGIAALFYGLVRAVFYKEKTPEELAQDRNDMRHDARWP